MKLNHELVRKLLLEVESQESSGMSQKLIDNFADNNQTDTYEIMYIMKRLEEANYLSIKITNANNRPIFYVIHSITWNGHQFLDTIRDDVVWRKTKSIVSKFSSVSLSLIEKIASNVITQLITQSLNSP